MTLLTYLRGTRPLANPTDLEPVTPRWTLSHRAADAPRGTPWTVLSRELDLSGAVAEVESLSPEIEPYDVLRLATKGDRVHWFVGEGRRAARLPKLDALNLSMELSSETLEPFGDDWVDAWESTPQPGILLDMAHTVGLPLPRLMAVAIACARRVLPWATVGDLRPLQALEAAERWLAAPDDKAASAVCEAASDRAWTASLEGEAAAFEGQTRVPRAWAAVLVAQVASHVALCTLEGVLDAVYVATEAVAAAEAPTPRLGVGWLPHRTTAFAKETRAQVDLVRVQVPLTAVLLAATGDPP